jgi:hypothetical protein
LLSNQAAAEADGDCMGSRASLELRQQMPDVALHRLLRQEEAMADLTVDESFGDQLKDFDLASGGLLLELPERSGERNYFGVALSSLRRHFVETLRVAYVSGQDLFALCSVHSSPPIGSLCPAL